MCIAVDLSKDLGFMVNIAKFYGLSPPTSRAQSLKVVGDLGFNAADHLISEM